MGKKSKPKLNIKWYGWKPDIPDFRDFKFSAQLKSEKDLPESVDLRKDKMIIFNQETLGSCTSNAIAIAHLFCQMKQEDDDLVIPSRLFIYYNTREIEGTIDVDAGAHLRDGIKSIAKHGVCDEMVWPYIIKDFAKKPTPDCYEEALNNQAIHYQRIPCDLNQMKTCLAEGFPFVFGFAVYTSFESAEMAKTGILNMPGRDETMKGGHAVIAVGYDDKEGRFLIQNSWGKDWGKNGYFTMPYEYMASPGLAIYSFGIVKYPFFPQSFPQLF